MKSLFDQISVDCSKIVTKTYSTSFSMATKMLHPSIRNHIYNIYGFVRFADEIVDSFHNYPKKLLLNRFEEDLYLSLDQKISLNPILNSFQHTYHKYSIEKNLVDSFVKSMRMDLKKKKYSTVKQYKEYIYGSADVVGLMCLKVFVQGNKEQYEKLKINAMKLGSAFQKVNFLRDIKADQQNLKRSYFPNTQFNKLSESEKNKIINEIEEDFRFGLHGIKELPIVAKFGVFIAYRYYNQLLKKLKKTPAREIINQRIRVPNLKKLELLTRSYVKYQLNLL